MSIKLKLTLLLVVLSCIPIIFYGLLSLSNFEKALTTDLSNQLTTVAEYYEQSILDYVTTKRENLTEIANLVATSVDFLTIDQNGLGTQLQEQLTDLPDNSRIFVLNKNGIVIDATDNQIVGFPFFHDQIMVDGLEKIHPLLVSRNQDGEAALFSFGPVVKDDEVLGVVVIEAPLQDFTQIFSQRFGLGESGELLVVSGDLEKGEELTFNSRRNDLVEKVFRQQLLKVATNELTSIVGGDGEVYLTITRPINETTLNLVVRAVESEVFAPVELLSRSLVSLLIISMFFVGILAYLSAKNLSDPIRNLVSFTKQVAKNKALSQIRVDSNDELGELGRSFNLMAAQLNDFYTNLEEKVSQRTIELENNKKAMLNLMEDLSIEKQYSDAQAHELVKFKQAVEAASDQIVITDPEGTVLYANQMVEELTGFSIQEAIGQKAGKLWGGLMSREYFDRMWQTIKVNKKVFVEEIVNRKKNGQQYVALVKISPVLDNDGKVLFFVGIERDITREKEIDRAKTEFVSLASHQLRTPLSIIRWYVDSLIQGKGGAIKPEGKTLEYLQAIEESNIRMIGLVGALLNVSRLELGTFSVNPKPESLDHLVEIAINEIMPLVKEKNLILNYSRTPNLPSVLIDQNLMLIVLQNLITNAVKYTGEGGKIEIKVAREIDELTVEVADTGYGIPEDQKGKIFTKLFRADNVKKKDVVGTGLGLYLVKTILDQVGGKIEFDSKLDIGSSFKIYLPISGMKAKKGPKQLEWSESELINK